jgi:hypothetical protein
LLVACFTRFGGRFFVGVKKGADLCAIRVMKNEWGCFGGRRGEFLGNEDGISVVA